MSLTTAQLDALLQPLDKKRVKQKQGNSHLEAWDIRRHLLRVFGWGGWTFEVLSCDLILERSVWESEKATETHKGRHTVAYRVTGRLSILDADGRVLAFFDDGATGDAQNQPGFADAHDMALKTAMSQALKRCAVNLGDRFGLSLYNKGTAGAVVGKSLAHQDTAEHDATEEVTGGELDEERTADDAPDKPTLVALLRDAGLSTAGNEETLRARWAEHVSKVDGGGASTREGEESDRAIGTADPALKPSTVELPLEERAQKMRQRVANEAPVDAKALSAKADA